MLTHMRARKYKRIKKSSDLVPRFRESNVEIIRFIRGEVLNSVDDRGFAAARVSVMLCLARSQDEWAPPLEMLPTFINHSVPRIETNRRENNERCKRDLALQLIDSATLV